MGMSESVYEILMMIGVVICLLGVFALLVLGALHIVVAVIWWDDRAARNRFQRWMFILMAIFFLDAALTFYVLPKFGPQHSPRQTGSSLDGSQ